MKIRFLAVQHLPTFFISCGDFIARQLAAVCTYVLTDHGFRCYPFRFDAYQNGKFAYASCSAMLMCEII